MDMTTMVDSQLSLNTYLDLAYDFIKAYKHGTAKLTKILLGMVYFFTYSIGFWRMGYF